MRKPSSIPDAEWDISCQLSYPDPDAIDGRVVLAQFGLVFADTQRHNIPPLVQGRIEEVYAKLPPVRRKRQPKDKGYHA